MAIYGTYKCDDCAAEFKGWRDADGPYPDCPGCGAEGGWAPQSPALKGVRAKAMDFVQRMAEEDYGMTDMNDHLRPGDIAAKAPPPIQTSEAGAITRELIAAGADANMGNAVQSHVQNFFGAGVNQSNASAVHAAVQSAVQSAPAAAAAARQTGHDPIDLLHKGKGFRNGIENIRPVTFRKKLAP